MHDLSFNSPRRAAMTSMVAVAFFLAGSAAAQMPGVPVLQNAWATAGIVGAVDFGGGSDGSTYAAAVGWTPNTGRFQISGGVGAQRLTGIGTKTVYGARVAIPFGGASSTFGFAAFAGIGGRGAAKTSVFFQPPGVTTPQAGFSIDTLAFTTEVPLGAAIGWRHTIGATHGISVYATPAYVLYSGGTKNGGLFRGAIAADVGITNALGATLGTDFGGKRSRALGGPSGSQFGLGISYAFGHH
jgi:hypothetical protein